MPRSRALGWRRGLSALLIGAALLGCGRSAEPVKDHVYVWQREQSAALTEALDALGDRPLMLKWLAIDQPTRGPRFVADPKALPRDRPLWLVVRVNGATPTADPAEFLSSLQPLLAVSNVVGVELDIDCARSRLADYAQTLGAWRAALPKRFTLAFTALPDWLAAPAALRDLRAAADSSVLQVHGVSDPRLGLFDAPLAARWIAAYARLGDRPFEVALPAYHLGVRFSANGSAQAWAGEAPADGTVLTALTVDPRAVAHLRDTIEANPPRGLRGWSWFRLPLGRDVRAFSRTTFHALIDRAPLVATWRVQRDGPDVLVNNTGNLDAAPPHIAISGDCRGDGARGFRFERIDPTRARLVGSTRLILAQRQARIGWLRCASEPLLEIVPP
jgi:hypothetical protein